MQSYQLKGKQVRILYDLVTVFEERRQTAETEPLTMIGWEGCL